MLAGAFTALITPFTSSGDIDYPALARLLAWHESEGMDGIVVGGTNGEGPSLSAVEKRDLVRFAKEHGGNLRVIVGLSTCSTAEAVWISEQGRKAGAEASLALPPFYFRAVAESGIEAWFRQILSASPLPCILYNFPKMTGFAFSKELLQRLFAVAHVVGIKESSGSMESLAEFAEVARESGKAIFVGDERLLLECLSHGGSGTISGLANSFPKLVSRAFKERSAAMQALVVEASDNVKKHPQPAVHKFILSTKGLPGGVVRPPLEDLRPAACEEVRAFVESFGF